MARTNQNETDKSELELRVIIKDKRVIDIISSIDFGFKRRFIESAILHFAQNQPSIKLHFEGITKPNKRGRKPKEVLKEVPIIQNETIPQINKQEESVTKKVTQTDETNTQSKLMFNF